MIKILLSIGLFLVALTILVYMLRKPVLKGQIFSILRPWYALILPPDDLYENRVKNLVIPFEIGEPYQFEFHHKYAGRYELGFITQQPLPTKYTLYDYLLTLKAQFFLDTQMIFDPAVSNQQSARWWFDGESGFTLLTYRIPDDIPIDTTIQCVITVIEANSGYFRKEEGIKLFIRKSGEK
ncbi:MAG: hypothetical protein HOO93_12600 [Methyloglobulus sp.]|nr:hypothetical protein [Methyloglobulus sp.]